SGPRETPSSPPAVTAMRACGSSLEGCSNSIQGLVRELDITIGRTLRYGSRSVSLHGSRGLAHAGWAVAKQCTLCSHTQAAAVAGSRCNVRLYALLTGRRAPGLV